MMTPTQLQAAIVRNQARVIDLLQWRPEQYARFVYDSGIEYLEKYIGQDKEAISIVESRVQFWNWWKLHFNARNEAFIEEWDGMEDQLRATTLEAYYLDINSAEVLAAEIHPPK